MFIYRHLEIQRNPSKLRAAKNITFGKSIFFLMPQLFVFIAFNLFLISLLFGNKAHCQNVDSLKNQLLQEQSIQNRALIFNQLANYYLDFDLIIANRYSDSAIHYAHLLNNFAALSDGYVNKANFHYYSGSLDSTLYYFEKSLETISRTNNEDQIASALNRMGLIYEAKSDYIKSAEYYYRALFLYEKTQNQLGLANIYNNLGVIFDALKNRTLSIVNYQRALNLFVKINNEDGAANTLNNLATIYAEKKDFNNAIQLINRSIRLFKKNNRKSEVATAYFNAATFYDGWGNIEISRQMLDSSFSYYSAINNLHGIANVIDMEADFLNRGGNKEAAIAKLKTSLSYREEVGNLSALASTLNKIAEISEEKGNIENALYYYKRYFNLRDSIVNDKVSEQIFELNAKYESEKKDKVISLLQKETEIKSTQNNFLIFLALALCAILLLLFYFLRTRLELYRRQKEIANEKERSAKLEFEKQNTEKKLLEKEIIAQKELYEFQQQQLDQSKRELAASTMQILNKNKTLSELNELIDTLNENIVGDKSEITQIQRKLRSTIKLDDDWEQFKLHFEKVNVKFFDNLKAKHPDLTAGDLKVCAYIKINLSNKEIAQMLNISQEGINKRLYRIRKKMQFPNNTKLSDYLSEF
jgi:tetratricopeptide (TPR) repeat protein/DNA-binding CsgD family transcriptional regulator